jgi:hypothetical protein
MVLSFSSIKISVTPIFFVFFWFTFFDVVVKRDAPLHEATVILLR